MHRQAAAGQTAKRTPAPRDLECDLLSRSAAWLQRVRDGWDGGHADLDGALTYNRRLWNLFLVSVTRPDSPVSRPVRQNVTNLGRFVIGHTIAVLSDPSADKLDVLITINRQLAAGLKAASPH
ncbi:MAG: flagellar biosynthesis regulator FlaF [Cucumibacter sp.]